MKSITIRLALWAALVGGILLIPLIFNAPWTLGDFVFAGVVLYGAATVYEVTTQNMHGPKKCLVAFLVVLAVMTFWAWAIS